MPNRRPKLELPKPEDTRLRGESPFRPAPSATPEEAAAIAAALEHFMRDTAPGIAAGEEAQDPWTRAALLEGVAREPGGSSPWGDAHPWR